jgi:hypothetical protein
MWELFDYIDGRGVNVIEAVEKQSSKTGKSQVGQPTEYLGEDRTQCRTWITVRN